MKNIESFEDHRRKRQERKQRMKQKFRQLHREAQDSLRDWQTDGRRSQSGRREADVVQ